MLVLAVVSLLIAVTALVVAGLALRATRSGRPRNLDDLPVDVLGLRQEVAALMAGTTGALRHFTLVRYDAFADAGGRLSWSLALLDDDGTGFVLTSIHGRNDSRTYAKGVAHWMCDQQLSPEEDRAIRHARP